MDLHSFQLSNGCCAFSPNGIYLAFGNQQQLFIRLVSNGEQVLAFQCAATVEYVEWSTDSELVLTTYRVIGKLEVWSLKDKNWKCQISNGPLGLLSGQFSPDSRHILTTSNLHLRLTVWSLCDQSVFHINTPKEASPGLDFSAGGIYMGVAEKRGARDFVGIYSCNPWTPICDIDPNTVDLGGLRWSPDASKVAVWDLVYPGKLKIFAINGSEIAEIEVFGIHDIQWSPTAQLIAAASAGSKVRIINHLSWSSITSLLHASKLLNRECVVYREKDSPLKYQIVTDRPITLANVAGSGRLLLAFSADDRYLAVADQTRPNLLWIWDVGHLLLKSILIQTSAIKSFVWSSKETHLVIGCGTAAIYVWSPLGCKIFNLQSIDREVGLKADRIECNINGKHVLVSSKNLVTLCQIC